MGGREGSRTHACPPLRNRRVRGHPRIRHRARTGDLSPRRPSQPPRGIGAPLLHGDAVLQGADPCRDPRADRPQRLAQLLHPAGPLPRARAHGPRPGRQSCGGHDRRLGVGCLSRRGGQAQWGAGEGLVVAANLTRVTGPARQGLRSVLELGAGEGRVQTGGVRGGDTARRSRPRLRGQRARTSSS